MYLRRKAEKKGEKMKPKKVAMLILGMSFLLGCTYGGGNMKVNVMNPAAPLYDEGMDAYNSGDYPRAITAFTDVVNYYPNNGLADESLFMLAKTYEKTKDDLDALRYYKLFLSRYPNHKWASKAQKSVDTLSNKIEKEGT
jgi:outer membrane protein assembly factor BamD (BamD/ComL family)